MSQLDLFEESGVDWMFLHKKKKKKMNDLKFAAEQDAKSQPF